MFLPFVRQDKFNWTMTYRRDSDIIHRYPFGALTASKAIRKSYGKTRPTANSVKRRLPRKKKLIAWITSTCPTSVRRENYVRELAKHISVDIYGGCGHKYCGSHEQVGHPVKKQNKKKQKQPHSSIIIQTLRDATEIKKRSESRIF